MKHIHWKSENDMTHIQSYRKYVPSPTVLSSSIVFAYHFDTYGPVGLAWAAKSRFNITLRYCKVMHGTYANT
jgi:hypothetical protein